jgi:hypothetical protein
VPEQKETHHLTQMLGHKSNTSHLHDSGRIASKYCLTDSLTKSTAKPDHIRECRRSVLDNVGPWNTDYTRQCFDVFRGCPMMFLPWCTLRIRFSSQENLCLQSLGSQGSSSCSSHSTDRRRRTFVLPRLTALFCGSILLLPHATEVIIPHLRIGFSYPEKTTATTYAAQWPFRLFRQTTTWRIQ